MPLYLMKEPAIFNRLFFIIFLGLILMNTSKVMAQEVIIQVDNIDTSKPGNVLVMLYSDKGFPKDHQQALEIKSFPATQHSYLVNFLSVPDTFAIKILHDEDENGEVTKNWTGILPAEGLGFSNGAKLFLGPPSFKSAKLDLSNVIQPIKISIIYP